MTAPFETRAVAFIDVLGFTNLIKAAEKTPSEHLKLQGLITTLDAHVKFDNDTLAPTVPTQVKPCYIFVSDTIIISCPLRHGQYDGLDIVVVKTIQIAQKLLELGHLSRGGVAVGNVWHTTTNIFGTAYIEACQTEKKASSARILLAESAAAEWRTSRRFAPGLCLEESGDIIVDVLHADYIRQAGCYGGIEGYVGHVRAHINAAMLYAGLPESTLEKWRWMARFFNAALKRHGVGAIVEPFDLIPNPR